MRSIRLAGLVLVAVLAVSLVASSTASAAGPLFVTSGKPTFTAPGKHLLILTTATTDFVECAQYSWSGEVSSATLEGNIHIHFLECTGKNTSGGECPAMSPGAPLENLIITRTLHGVLGLALPKPASGSDAGLLLLPNQQPILTLLGSCILETALEGSVAGLVEPVGVSSTTDKIVFGVTSGKQDITDIDLTTGGLVAPKLSVFGVNDGTLEASDEFTFSAKVEVT